MSCLLSTPTINRTQVSTSTLKLKDKENFFSNSIKNSQALNNVYKRALIFLTVLHERRAFREHTKANVILHSLPYAEKFSCSRSFCHIHLNIVSK